jgi:membrane protease YdiL (CAAX protease family)
MNWFFARLIEPRRLGPRGLGPGRLAPGSSSWKRTVKQNLLEMTLLFLAFYLPGMLIQDGGLQIAEHAPARFMAQSILAALPQVALFLYLLWLRAQGRALEPPPSPEQAPPGSPTGPLLLPVPAASAGVSSSRPAVPRSVSAAFERFGLVRIRPRDLLQGVLVFSGAAAVLLAAAMLLRLIPGTGRQFLTEGFRFHLGDWRLVPLALVFGLVIGYREELFFRGYLLTRLAEIGVPAAPAVAGSTLLFAMGHLYQGPAGFVTAAALGAYFGTLFTRRRNLHRLALAHGLYNTAVLVASLWIAP